MKSPIESLTVQMQGGLANQLFQWATFESLWDASRGPVMWDERLVCRPGRRGNELVRIGLVPREVVISQPSWSQAAWHLTNLLPVRLRDFLTGRIRPLPPPNTAEVLTENRLSLITAREHWWAQGYFQNPDIFVGQRDSIRAVLRATLEEASKSKSWIFEDPYAAIHVRRGDYVSVPEIANRLGVCSLEYFVSSAADISSVLPVKVLSDDPAWCKEVLTRALPSDVHVVETGSDISDLLVLMGACELVLSNSTFSWWGAFAGGARRVVGPSRFFDADDAGGKQLAQIADIRRDKLTGRRVD